VRHASSAEAGAPRGSGGGEAKSRASRPSFGAELTVRSMHGVAQRPLSNGSIGLFEARFAGTSVVARRPRRVRSDEHLAFAREFHEANDVPSWAARCHLGWAEALAERGDVDGTLEHATRALELSRDHGYGAVELARRLWSRRSQPPGPEALRIRSSLSSALRELRRSAGAVSPTLKSDAPIGRAGRSQGDRTGLVRLGQSS
jgi:hypothetical protein